MRPLPGNVDLISRVAPNAALYEPAAPRPPKQKGPPRKKGDRLPGMTAWADDEASAYVRSVNDGDEVVPTVVIAGTPRTNPPPREVLAAL